MIIILDWIFEGMVTWIAGIITVIMDAVSGLFLDALNTDMLVMEQYFPFVTKAYEIMQYTSWCVLFLITIWQLFKAFGGPITEAENPLHLIVRSALFAFLIGYARPIFHIALDIARAPYTALMDSSMDPGDFTFAGIENVLITGLITTLAVSTVVGLILIIILMLILGWNYFKTLLLAVERYIVVGVLCYTSPLSFAMGGSKATEKVFQSWCRMVGAQLLLLVMNVWFLRAFNSSVGYFTASGGALSSGHGSIFLWLFCALAFLKTAQKFDSILASLGLNIAQTCGLMGMEMLMATRALGGFGGKTPRSAGSMFGGATAGAAGSMGVSGAGTGLMSGIASKFKGNSYVRDAVVDGGSRIGAGGGIGFVGRAFGGVAARTGAALTGDSISSVASRHPSASGSIGGNIADRSIANYMPHLSGTSVSGTQITGGQISATAIGANGKEASLRMFNSSMYERPDIPHSVVKASDGSTWYQTATGEGMASFYSPATNFTGDASEAAQVKAAFPDVADGTSLRTVDEGRIEATNPDGSTSMWYNSAMYNEPDAPHSSVSSADGVSWYAMQPHADPNFETGEYTGTDIASGQGGIIGGSETPIIGSSVDTADINDSTTLPGGSGVNVSVGAADGDVTVNTGMPDSTGIQDSTTLPGGATTDSPVTGKDMNDTTALPGGINKAGELPLEASAISDTTKLPGGTAETVPAADGIVPPELSSGSGTIHVESSSIITNGITSDTTGMSESSSVTDSVSVGETAAGADIVSRNIGNYSDTTAPLSSSTISYDAAYMTDFNNAQFSQFMPGYEQEISSVDASRQSEGTFEVRHQDGTGTAFYDSTRYKTPRGEHQLYEDSSGGQWYAVQGTPTVERRPVYEDGKAVYDGGQLQTTNVESIKYKTTPEKFGEPKKRNVNDSKPARKKQ